MNYLEAGDEDDEDSETYNKRKNVANKNLYGFGDDFYKIIEK